MSLESDKFVMNSVCNVFTNVFAIQIATNSECANYVLPHRIFEVCGVFSGSTTVAKISCVFI